MSDSEFNLDEMDDSLFTAPMSELDGDMPSAEIEVSDDNDPEPEEAEADQELQEPEQLESADEVVEAEAVEDSETEWVDEVADMGAAIGLTRDEVEQLGSRQAFDAVFRMGSRLAAASPKAETVSPSQTEQEEEPEEKPDPIDELLGKIDLESYSEEDNSRTDMQSLMDAVRALRDENKGLRSEVTNVQQMPSAADQAASVLQFHNTLDEMDPKIFGKASGDEGNLTSNQMQNRQLLLRTMDAIVDGRASLGMEIPSEGVLRQMAYQAAFSDQLAAGQNKTRVNKLRSQSGKRQSVGSRSKAKGNSTKINPFREGDVNAPDLAEAFQEMSS